MSGPKVISTVTIQERREAARVQLALADRALDRWRHEMAGDQLTQSRLDRLIEERNRIARSLESDQLADVAARSEAVAAAVRHDIERRQEELDTRRAEVQSRERSLRHAARSLLDRCNRADLVLPEDDRRRLEQASRGDAFDIQDVARVVANALAGMAQRDLDIRSRDQRALADALSGTPVDSSATETLRRLEVELQDPRIRTVERQIAELIRLGESKFAEEQSRRLSALLESAPDVRSHSATLTLDVLGLELSGAVVFARRRAAIRQDLVSETAAATATNDFAACRQSIEAAEFALEARQLDSANASIEQIRQTREVRRRQRGAQAARTTILSGLKQLGYDVREGMQTAWGDRKQLVVRHPDRRGVALELSGNGETGRLQTRMVAVQGAIRGAETDKQVEETWCRELTVIQDAAAQAGGSVRIERSLPAGHQPLKVVVDEYDDLVAESRAAQSRMREGT